MPSYAELKTRRREDYPFMLDYRTRWNDNDMYDHMNNSVYNFLFDSIVNTYLINECGLHPPDSSQYALAVHSQADFLASIAYPAVADLCLRVIKLGKSSVTYEVALFEQGVPEVKAVAEFVHVFVERATGKTAKDGMTQAMRDGLERIYTKPASAPSKL